MSVPEMGMSRPVEERWRASRSTFRIMGDNLNVAHLDSDFTTSAVQGTCLDPESRQAWFRVSGVGRVRQEDWRPCARDSRPGVGPRGGPIAVSVVVSFVG